MVVRNWDDAVHDRSASATTATRIIRLVRHRRYSAANTASITGIVTRAVRETMTKVMLASRPTTTAQSSTACHIFPSRNSVKIG